jgi:DNA helicase-2/ATP-dependent DNA helicase PcrA
MANLELNLNECQREAVLHTEGPLIVLAGAGSGKTKMLTSRIAHLIDELGVAAHQILAVTFTNKAAAEMRERVDKILGLATVHTWGGVSLGSPEIGTFHSVCVRLLRREMIRTPFTKPFVIYDDSDQLSLIKTVLEKLQINDKAFNPKAIQAAINRAKCDALEPHELEPPTHNVFEKQVKRVYEHYQKDLFANNAVDFGEIICMTYRLLRDHPDLRKKYQERYRYIHVDEYQDTNRAQYLLLSILASTIQGGHKNICVVGDEDQSIYKWRGADIRNILDFESDYPGARTVKLEQNYRSTKMILAAAGHVIRNNKSRKDKTLWTENEDGQRVIRAQLPDERAEAEMTVSEIKRLAELGNRAYSEFAIFYRTNAQSRQFEDVLRREKIPYQVVGGLRFYDRKEIKDILSYFRIILNPADSISLKRIINVPARGIGKTTLEKLEQFHADSHGSYTFWDVLERAATDTSMTSAGTAKKIASFVQLIQRFMNEQPKLLLTELYHLILDETGYVRELRKEGTEESLSRIENLEEFNTLLQEFEEEQLEGMDEETQKKKRLVLLPIFIEQSMLASDVEKTEGNESAVKLMTLHSSKGLEFPVAFIVGMEEGLFPSIKPWEETPEEDIEEERRLCYVGMTRAREVLYLMNVIIRRIWGNVSYQEPSRFFSEIPDEFLEFKDLSYGVRATEYRTGSSRQFGHMGRTGLTTNSSSLTGEYSQQVMEGWVGKQMLHPEYGKGTVVSSEGSGNDQKVTIQFMKNGQRKFLLRYVASYFG